MPLLLIKRPLLTKIGTKINISEHKYSQIRHYIFFKVPYEPLCWPKWNLTNHNELFFWLFWVFVRDATLRKCVVSQKMPLSHPLKWHRLWYYYTFKHELRFWCSYFSLLMWPKAVAPTCFWAVLRRISSLSNLVARFCRYTRERGTK